MRAFLATVLSVIAVGVLLIAYGLLGTRVAAAPDMLQYDARGQGVGLARPIYASERLDLNDPYYPPYAGARAPMAYPVNSVRQVPAYDPYVAAPAPAPRQVVTRTVPQTTRVVEPKAAGRDWKKTAMVIGGSSAAGAGLGAIFGGKKGALIGAAIGGGAGTLYEVKKR
jgi:hypothetical protein